ncbi:MAG: proline dehydrogenase [Chloroflexi bacterium]|nr:proline dehydrogenase [Chloroflexota bacterium]
MFRSILLYLAKARWARRIITGWKLSRLVASRFIAGDTLNDAVRAVRALNAAGLTATLDHLGEAVTTEAEARSAADDYLVLIDKICETGLRSNASLKLSQLGLNLSRELCLENLRRIVRKAAACGLFVRIDMEDTSTVDWTLEIWRSLQRDGLSNVGLVFQSYLFRTENDIRAVLSEGCRIRMCKGAYKEPPNLAYPKKSDVDASYDRLARIMIDAARAAGSVPVSADGRIPPVTALATHDEARIAAGRAYAEQAGLPKAALEFQMLNGIRADLQRSLAQAGYPVRVYVPYGTEWYPYFMRRLAERPANVWFFVSNFFR